MDLSRVYRAQNSRLWTSLAQHLDNEFDKPRLTTRIAQAGAEQLLKRVGIEGASAKRNAEAVLAKLAFLGERANVRGYLRNLLELFRASQSMNGVCRNPQRIQSHSIATRRLYAAAV